MIDGASNSPSLVDYHDMAVSRPDRDLLQQRVRCGTAHDAHHESAWHGSNSTDQRNVGHIGSG